MFRILIRSAKFMYSYDKIITHPHVSTHTHRENITMLVFTENSMWQFIRMTCHCERHQIGMFVTSCYRSHTLTVFPIKFRSSETKFRKIIVWMWVYTQELMCWKNCGYQGRNWWDLLKHKGLHFITHYTTWGAMVCKHLNHTDCGLKNTRKRKISIS